MPALHNDVYDDGLNVLTTLTEKLYILKADPGLSWADIATHAIGVKATPTVSAPEDRTAGGRQVTVSAILDGDITATETATNYALTDDSETKILASGDLAASQVVTTGNTFTLTAITIGIPDPV